MPLNGESSPSETLYPLSATVSGEQDWAELHWVCSDGITPYEGGWEGKKIPEIRLTGDQGKICSVPSATIGTLKVGGDGSLVIDPPSASGFSVGCLDFSGHAARGEVGREIAFSNIVAGADTRLARAGTGILTVGSGKRVTWKGFAWPTGKIVFDGESTIVVQGGSENSPIDCRCVTGPSKANSYLVVTNGCATLMKGQLSANIKLIVENGGTFLLGSTGWRQDHNPLTVNKGGIIRYTHAGEVMRRGMILNGGRVEIPGIHNSGRTMDFYLNPTIKVTEDSWIKGLTVPQNGHTPTIFFRNDGNVKAPAATFDVDEGATLYSHVIYNDLNTPTPKDNTFIIKTGKGKLIQNSMINPATHSPYAFVLRETQTYVKQGTYELNCDHNGTWVSKYEIYSGARFAGTGSINSQGPIFIGTGEKGGATLCGSLKMHSLLFLRAPQENPHRVGDSEYPADILVSRRLGAKDGSHIRIQNGKLTIGETCGTAGSQDLLTGTSNHAYFDSLQSAIFDIAPEGILSVQAGGKLTLDRAPTFHEGSGIRVGATFGEAGNTRYSEIKINAEVDLTGVAFEIDLNLPKRVPLIKIPLLTAKSIKGSGTLTTARLPETYRWLYKVDKNPDDTETLYAEIESASILILD